MNATPDDGRYTDPGRLWKQRNFWSCRARPEFGQRRIGVTIAIFAACLAVVTLMGHHCTPRKWCSDADGERLGVLQTRTLAPRCP